MTKTLLIGSTALLAALIACQDRPDPTPSFGLDDQARAEANLQKARDAEADKYAPALFGAAVEALEKGVTGEEGADTAGAETLAAQSIQEAIRVREEAKEAAQRAILSATVLHSLVETILSHNPPRLALSASDARLAELKREILRAREAYELGDFPRAGITAQDVAAELISHAGPPTGT